MFQKLLYLVFFIVIFPFRLLAWGEDGHQIVAELAMQLLSDATRQKVVRVLGGISAAEAGKWMDNVRSKPAYRHMATWHYVNIEKGQSYKPSSKGDIITALNKAYSALQHPEKLSPEQVKLNVLILFHLCGDLLQPLHAGYGSDKGGTKYQVSYNGKGTNLHHIWDSEIIEKGKITLATVKSRPSAASIQKLRTEPVNFIAWMNQGRNLLPQVYDIKGRKLDNSYMQKNKAVVEAQLRNAGILLASCLEHIFSQGAKYRG
jgi:hypothetical protein